MAGDVNNRCADCDCICVGDFVEHRMNTDVIGMVLGFEGSVALVRLSPSLKIARFHDFELRHADDEEYHGPEPKEADNVIDFTKERDLRTAKTEGAA